MSICNLIERFKIKIRTFSHPADINWLYVKRETDDFVCKKILLNLASIAVLLFLTTPAVRILLIRLFFKLCLEMSQ